MDTLSRRRFLKIAGLGTTATLLAACQPKVVEKVVKETVEVEKVVKETVVIEGEAKEVTKVVEKAVTTTPAAVAPIEIKTFRWVPGAAGAAGSPIPEDDCMVKVDVEKALNIKLDIWWIERATWLEQLSTRFAGGDYIDYGNLWNPPWIDQGLLGKITLTDFAIGCPRFFMDLAKYDDGSLGCFYGGIYNGLRITYGVYIITQIYPFCVGWRKDALDKIGMEVPTTLDDMETALRKFVSEGIFKYATRFRGGDSVSQAFREVGAAYGASHDMWSDDGQGGIINGYMHPAHKQELIKAQQWYKEGLVHPESATTKAADFTAAWCQNEFGFNDVTTWYRLLPNGEHYDCIVQQGGEVAMGPAPKGPNGDYGYGSWGKGRNGDMIGSQVDRNPEKKAKILELTELVNADPDWAEYVRYGKPEHNYRDEFGALYLKPADELGIDPNKLGAGTIWSGDAAPSLTLSWLRKDQAQINELCGPGTLKYYGDTGKFADMTPCKDFTELGPMADKWRMDCITGVIDPEKDWDRFVNDYMAMGGECQLKQMEEALINQKAVDRSIRTEVDQAMKGMQE